MNTFKKITLAIIVSGLTQAATAETSDMSVQGEIVPAACSASFSGAGQIDYGDVSSLIGDDYTVLPAKQIEMRINCSSPTVVGYRFSAGRPGTLVTKEGVRESADGFSQPPVALLNGNGNSANQATGIGLDASGNKIGGMALNIAQANATVDGAHPPLIYRDDRIWGTFPSHATIAHYYLFAWGEQQRMAPRALKNAVAQVDLQVFLNKRAELDLTQPVNFDGLVTLELIYI